jgi:hypothetical protein
MQEVQNPRHFTSDVVSYEKRRNHTQSYLEIMASVLTFMQGNLPLFSISTQNVIFAPCSILSDVMITMETRDTAVFLRRLSDCMIAEVRDG